MTETVAARKVTPLTALRRHVGISLLLVILGIAAAVGWVVSQPRTYTAEARLAVAGTSLTAEQVPGFALASQELAADYARYVNNSATQSTLEQDLGVDEGSVEEVVASPIPESNVVRIEVLADSERTAVEAAATIAQRLIDRVNDSDLSDEQAAEALVQFTTLSQQVADAEQRSLAAQNDLDSALGRASSGFPNRGDDIPALRAAAATAASELSVLEVQQEALGERYRQLVADIGTASNLNVIQESTSQGDDLVAKAQRFGLLGLAVGLLLALAASTGLEKRRRRRAAAPDPAATPYATPPVPAGTSAPDETTLPVETRSLTKAGAARDDGAR